MAIKDCFTKEWQGYNFSMSFLASYAIRAVEDAVLRAFDGEVPKGLILKTDNGPHYIAKQFGSAISMLGIHTEYIQKHTPEDNDKIESFRSSLKSDYVWPFESSDFNCASVAIDKMFYNHNDKRPHSSIDYVLPRELGREF